MTPVLTQSPTPDTDDGSIVIAVSRVEWNRLCKQVSDMHTYIANLHEGFAPVIKDIKEKGPRALIGMMLGRSG